MSAGARWTLGLFMIAFAVGWMWLPFSGLVLKNHWLAFVIAGFCLLIGVVCIPGATGKIAGRVVSGVSGLVCVGYIVDQLFEPGKSFGRSDANLPNAVIVFFAFGLPALIFAFWGRFPGFGRLSSIARSISKDDSA